LRSEAKIIVDSKRFVFHSFPMNKTYTTKAEAIAAAKVLRAENKVVKIMKSEYWMPGRSGRAACNPYKVTNFFIEAR